MRGDWLTVAARGYLGVWMAFAGALRRDLGRDLHVLSDEAATLTGLIFMQACYYTCLLTLMSGLTTSGLTAVRAMERISWDAAVIFALLIVGLSTIPTLLCFWPARR